MSYDHKSNTIVAAASPITRICKGAVKGTHHGRREPDERGKLQMHETESRDYQEATYGNSVNTADHTQLDVARCEEVDMQERAVESARNELNGVSEFETCDLWDDGNLVHPWQSIEQQIAADRTREWPPEPMQRLPDRAPFIWMGTSRD